MQVHRGFVSMRPATRFVVSLVLITFVFGFQLLGLPQPVTGPVVNATIAASALMIGPWYASGIGLVTPAIAWMRGILPGPLAPMIPFIAIGNAVFALVFHAFSVRGNHKMAVVTSAVMKFAVLALAVRVFVTVPSPVAVAMQWPQLWTALAGACVAICLHKRSSGRK